MTACTTENYTPLVFQWELITTIKDMELLASYLKNCNEPIGIDTETNGLYGELAGVSFSVDGKRGWYIPIRHSTIDNNIDEKDFVDVFRPLLESPDILWVFWNVVYDFVIFSQAKGSDGKGSFVEKFSDAMLMSALVDENSPKALKYRSMQEFNLDPDTVNTFDSVVAKGTHIGDVDIDLAGKYAVQDTILTIMMYHYFNDAPAFQEFKHVYENLELPIARIICDMKLRGIRIDPDKVMEIHSRLMAEKQDLETQIYYEASLNPETGEYEAYQDKDGVWQNLLVFNLQSSKQKNAVLIERLGMPIVFTTKSGAPSFDSKKALPKYKALGYKMGALMMRHSQVTKILQAYTIGLVEKMDENERIHPDFKQTGAKTWRFSCSNPNFQSMPKGEGIRTVYIPAEGHQFIGCDYDQLELRIACYFSEDKGMYDSIMNHPDMHSKNASFVIEFAQSQIDMWAKSPDPLDNHIAETVVPKRTNGDLKFYGWTDEMFMAMKDSDNELDKAIAKKFRNIAKAICFGIQYGMGPRPDMGITQADIDRYLELYSGLRDYMEEHREFVHLHGYTRTILGRRRRVQQKAFSKWKGTQSSAFRQAFSAHVQGTAADAMKIAMVNMNLELKEKNIPCYIVAQVHDEVLLECEDAYVEEAMEVVGRCMEDVAKVLQFEVGGEPLPLTAEPQAGNSWEAVK